MPTRFAVESRRDGPRTVVAVRGDLDLVTAPAFASELEAAVRSTAEQVIVDLSGCEFLCSVGLAALLRVDRQLSPDPGRRLTILPGPPQVQRVFEITGLRDALPFAS